LYAGFYIYFAHSIGLLKFNTRLRLKFLKNKFSNGIMFLIRPTFFEYG